MTVLNETNTMLILLLLLPIIMIDLGFRIYAIIDVHKPERRVRHLSKTIWTIVIVLVSLSWIVYLLIGREDVIIED